MALGALLVYTFVEQLLGHVRSAMVWLVSWILVVLPGIGLAFYALDGSLENWPDPSWVCAIACSAVVAGQLPTSTWMYQYLAFIPMCFLFRYAYLLVSPLPDSSSATCTITTVRTWVDDCENDAAFQLYISLVTKLQLMGHGGVFFYMFMQHEVLLAAFVGFCAYKHKTVVLSMVSDYLPATYGLAPEVSSLASSLKVRGFSVLVDSEIELGLIFFGSYIFKRWANIPKSSERYTRMLWFKYVLFWFPLVYEALYLVKGCMKVWELPKVLGCETDFGGDVSMDSQLPGVFLQLHVTIIATRLLANCNLYISLGKLRTLINNPSYAAEARRKQIERQMAAEWRSHFYNMVVQVVLYVGAECVQAMMSA